MSSLPVDILLSKQRKNKEHDGVMRWCGIMGFINYNVKQPPDGNLFRLTQTEMFTDEVMY